MFDNRKAILWQPQHPALLPTLGNYRTIKILNQHQTDRQTDRRGGRRRRRRKRGQTTGVRSEVSIRGRVTETSNI